MNVNTFQMMGLVLRISMRQLKPGSNEKVGTMLIRYGEKRDARKGKRVQYVNAAKLKIPPKAASMVESIKKGDIVSVMGRIQGLSRGNDVDSLLVISSCRRWSPRMMGYDLHPIGAAAKPADTHDEDSGDELAEAMSVEDANAEPVES